MFSSLPFGLMFFLIMVFGTFFSISSPYWLGIWAGLEVNLIGFLPLLVYQKKMSESESAVKYFIVQAMGSSFLMFGSLVMYNLLFTWEVFDIKNVMLGAVFLFCGLFIKMGLFPFHFWLPGVMAGLSWMSCLMLATWQKIAPLFLLCVLLLEDMNFMIGLIFCLLSVGSALIGGLGGMNQTQLRSLLAYSSIGHLGWIVFVCFCSSWAMKVYLIIYISISIGLFMNLWYANFDSMKNLNKFIENFNIMSLLVMLLSLGGLPPMLGFISKWVVMSVSVSNVLWGFVFMLILGSLMSLFYYLSLFFSVFFVSYKNKSLTFYVNSKNNSLLVGNVLLNLFGGIFLISTDLICLM
uniref:NADH dehydrogenase subunit 2 n=1 Tax=Optediceros sp. TaxID=3114356 RepID=UPI002E793FFE|nr:NADH dehydrogenase subunit 2 [Optediceros sp.]WPR14855.1 NADH dehydrogenase subunit 2 [Optediceros sp.]